jgi:alpha-glucosidase
MVMMLFISLRGNIILWQGEELGLTQVEIPFAMLQDPEAIANWPLGQSRDGARTPMPWVKSAVHCDFSRQHPWLPLGTDHVDKAVDVQEADAESMLTLTRSLIAYRQGNEALLLGRLDIIAAADALLIFERVFEGEHCLCAFNFGDAEISWEAPQQDRWRIAQAVNDATLTNLPPFGAVLAERIA